VTNEQKEAERREVALFLAQPGGETLLKHLGRRYRTGSVGETGDQMLNRLGRIDALSDIERLRDEAKGT
jgi:hypothetical protein